MKRNVRILLWVALAALLAAVILLVSCKKSSTGPKDTGSWTVMVYGDGNNNLDTLHNTASYIIQDVQDMEKVGSQGGLNIVAMVSSLSSAGRAKYYKIEYKPNDNVGQLTSQVLEDLGTSDMSNGNTLKLFINYAKAHYPASHYLLVIDDHGGGWTGTCWDDLNGGGGKLTLQELKDAISSSDLHRVDVVTFHACLMATVEAAYEIRSVASYMTASQFTMPMENVLGADLWMAWMKDNLTASPKDVAHKIAEKVIEKAQAKQKTTHYAVIDLAQIEALGSKVGHFGSELVNNSGQYWNEVVQAWTNTHVTNLDEATYVDLREFANHVADAEHLQAINLIRNAANDVIAALNSDAAVPYTSAHFEAPQLSVPRGGLNIFLPWNIAQWDSVPYRQLEFDVTGWHSFISAFVPNAGGGGGGGNNCATDCANAQVIQLNQTYTCTNTTLQSFNWFAITLPNQGNYRFQLCGFQDPTDFDLGVAQACADPNWLHTSAEVGCEDATWNLGGQIVMGVQLYAGGGDFQFTVSAAAPNIAQSPSHIGRY